ncbi:site-specific DNA-methyltransferase [Chryseobacterium sp.]|uniref:site-specific DNA-methyltransferase n=1 Tax=Chryseobacterium sp. TaxID=1871047 RepID=UPI0011C8A49A|nr:site-specific DNA-methyltransferase [Chryseobacterium sp.]TXF74972.1 site-specific DNA-methyltransferase [Chryseobacterium sp.]
MNKQDLIKKINKIQDISREEKAYLIDLVNTKKKYGLVWENKPEDVEEQLRSMLPVFKEVKERAIISEDKTAPNHILIEGDNLHALTALTYTHEGKIDVIYIDPPYNTGKEKEFKYNDKYVDLEDSFRHSKWLSFMNKRLRIAKKLLSEKGVIFISIDDNEQAQLKMLCDEIFNTNKGTKNTNHLASIVWDLGTGTSAGHFTRSHEYILAYTKNRDLVKNFEGGEGIIDDRAVKKIGIKNPASEFKFPAGTRFDAPSGFELTESWGGTETLTLVEGKMISENGILKEDVILRAGWTQKKQMKSFFEGLETFDSKGQRVLEFYFRNNGKIYSRKQKSTINPSSVLRSIATTKQGSSLIKEIFSGEEPISFVKPIELLKYILNLFDQKSLVLDFFAGSGTTLHATMALNAENGGNRQCILVTNNENNIAEEVTYERNKRVIQGYTSAKGDKVEGLMNNNLRYYQSDFIPSARTEVNRRQLTARSTELLCIKENCYHCITADFGINPKQAQLFTDLLGSYMVVIYHSRNMEAVVEKLTEVIQGLETTEKVKIYAFSPEKDSIEDDFFAVQDKIETVPLPDSIYNAYRATFRTLKLSQNQAAASTQNQDN